MSHDLKKLLQSERIPTLPAIALQIVRLAQEREPDFGELAKVIRADPAIATRIMRVANSALFGLTQKPKSIEAAIPVLGVTMIRTLILGFTLADTKRKHPGASAIYQRLWRSALAQASVAETLSDETSVGDPANWFLAGLLQDIGQLALLNCLGDEYVEVLSSPDYSSSPIEVERSALGFDHTELSVGLLQKWDFESDLIEAVGKHHTELHLLRTDDTSELLPLALAVASRGNELLYASPELTHECWQELTATFTSFPGINEEGMRHVIGHSSERTEECAAAFQIDIGDQHSALDILMQANEVLSSVAMKSQVRESKAVKALAKAKDAFFKIRKKVAQVQDDAHRDALTGVYNRGHFEAVFEQWYEECKRNGAAALLFLDVDDFKSVNDTYGHDAGDEAIRTVAKAIRSATRASDAVFRYGGDEFVVLLHNCCESRIEMVAERIRAAVTDAKLKRWPELQLSTSVGAVHLLGEQLGRARDALVATADRAMYRAKGTGGNHVVVLKTLAS